MLQDSAREGAMLLPGMGLTSASWVADRTMNGVPWMLSAGSNHVGTSVVWTAQVICPSGAASAGAVATSAVSATTRKTGIFMAALQHFPTVDGHREPNRGGAAGSRSIG